MEHNPIVKSERKASCELVCGEGVGKLRERIRQGLGVDTEWGVQHNTHITFLTQGTITCFSNITV